MNGVYERDLDLNLLRVLVVVMEEGSVTRAAARLYLTQPAVSAALGRLRRAVGEPLFVREGRTLAPTARGRRVYDAARPHLAGLLESVRGSAPFEPRETKRVFKLGLSDDAEHWLLPGLLDRLGAEAPQAKVAVLTVQFRTVVEALVEHRVEAAVTVADETPKSVGRVAVGRGGFVCVYDPAHTKVGRALTLERYLALPHVVVSYNGDLRGLVEDALGLERNVVCSTPRFGGIGGLLSGSGRIATVPELVARTILATHRELRACALPFELKGVPIELLWPKSLADDPASAWLRGVIAAVAREATKPEPRRRAPRARAPR